MEGFLQHVAPQFLHPALQSFGCGAFRPIAGAFHPLYPAKAFSRHFTDQYALTQATMTLQQRQPFFGELREEARSPPLYRGGPFVTPREGSSSPGSAASASPDPRPKEDETPCAEDHDFLKNSQKLRCGVCGARLGPGVAQAHFMQELQHLYSLSAPPRDPAPPHHDEDARWETYQRIKANRQRRLRMKSRKRHSVESLLYDDDVLEERMRKPETRCDEDEPVDVEGDSIGWPEGALTAQTEVMDKEPLPDVDNSMRVPLNYSEDLEISSTNDGVQTPEHSTRLDSPKLQHQHQMQHQSQPDLGLAGSSCRPADNSVCRPVECVSTSEVTWGALTAGAYLKANASAASGRPQSMSSHKIDGENQPSSTDPHN